MTCSLVTWSLGATFRVWAPDLFRFFLFSQYFQKMKYEKLLNTKKKNLYDKTDRWTDSFKTLQLADTKQSRRLGSDKCSLFIFIHHHHLAIQYAQKMSCRIYWQVTNGNHKLALVTFIEVDTFHFTRILNWVEFLLNYYYKQEYDSMHYTCILGLNKNIC